MTTYFLSTRPPKTPSHWDALAADVNVDGILAQHPMPSQIDERAVLEAITPANNVDGVTLTSLAAMSLGTRPGRPALFLMLVLQIERQ